MAEPAPIPSLPTPPTGWKENISHLGRALRSRNYRLFFFGQGTSLIGTWMQATALGWLVYRLTHSRELLGVVAFSSQLMTFLLAPFAGVLADRINRRKVLIATQVVASLQAMLLAVLTLTGMVTVWQIIALSMVLGLAAAFEMPTRQAFVVEMLEDRADLPNAIAMNSFLVNGSRLIGPPAAGLIIALCGEGVCFAANSASYLAVLLALLAMRVSPRPVNVFRNNVLGDLKEGVVYAFRFRPIRAILGLLTAISLVGLPYSVLMPVFAMDILHGDSSTQGLLMGSVGVGALAGTFLLASRPSTRGLTRTIVMATAVFGLAIIGFGLSTNLAISMAVLAAAGLGMMVQIAGSNTFIQSIVDDDKRGRVMSLHTMCFMGMGTFGNLLMGFTAHRFGAPAAVIAGGVGCLVAAGVFASRRHLLESSLEVALRERECTPSPEAVAVEDRPLTVPAAAEGK
ncbi:MAG: MFS transporter [Phycisphaerae bacterium]|jgi:MFS family permease